MVWSRDNILCANKNNSEKITLLEGIIHDQWPEIGEAAASPGPTSSEADNVFPDSSKSSIPLHSLAEQDRGSLVRGGGK